MKLIAVPAEPCYCSPVLGKHEGKVVSLLADFLDDGPPVTALNWTHQATVYVLERLPEGSPKVDGYQIDALLLKAQAKQRSLLRRAKKLITR